MMSLSSFLVSPRRGASPTNTFLQRVHHLHHQISSPCLTPLHALLEQSQRRHESETRVFTMVETLCWHKVFVYVSHSYMVRERKLKKKLYFILVILASVVVGMRIESLREVGSGNK